MRAVLLTLPPGDTYSYGWVADQAGYPGRARAVGTFLASATDDEIPWWRSRARRRTARRSLRARAGATTARRRRCRGQRTGARAPEPRTARIAATFVTTSHHLSRETRANPVRTARRGRYRRQTVTLPLMVVCYLVSFPVVAYGIHDLARIPQRLYQYTSYTRRGWAAAIVVGYACFGLGGIVMTLAWLSSSERAELQEELVLDAVLEPSRVLRRHPDSRRASAGTSASPSPGRARDLPAGRPHPRRGHCGSRALARLRSPSRRRR